MTVPVGSSVSPATPNLNNFLTKKTITQGLLDVALLTANVAQLKYVMSLGANGSNAHPFYYPMLILIWFSILLQVSTGICLILLGKTQVNEKTPSTRAQVLNDIITVQVFLIAVINILTASFNIEETIQRSGKFDDWINGNTSEYLKACTCADPVRAFHQSEHIRHKIHCQ